MKPGNIRRKPSKKNQQPVPMNRKARRKARSVARKAYKTDGIASDPAGNPQLDAMLGTFTLQDRLHRAIKDHHQGKVMSQDDIAEVVQVLGVTTAGIAASIGWGEFEFAEKMRANIRSVLDALEQAQPKEPSEPQIVMP